ncbi:uncharacterized protein LDX57_004477 [Aspergillus melleus]|uniref:uncharacterized protein n=1 Tax=Aspergillus melleus TaxID=138277 RepID=UPI001E8D0749|nr:uncharacterized protein LDX57_004477 [Aspergillus melleus]KAH8426744.1 hypothetical protein LDX57_004477 [Aspergillus melleus]
MVGGNPSHDAYSLLEHPRCFCNIRVYSRFCVFFIRGAICVGVILASNDPKLVDAIESETSSAASSPWIIAMENLVIIGLSHLATALMLTAVFSAGNTYCHAAMHALYGLAVGGRAPRLFLKTNARGVPIYCFIVAMAFGCLSFMQMSGNSKTGLNWLIRLTTTNVLINYVVISITYLCFYRACQAQGLDRSQLPYYARFQPYCGYVSTGWMTLMLFCYGYRTFAPWSAESFFLDYTMMVLAPILFISWKIVHKTRWLRPSEVDLQ